MVVLYTMSQTTSHGHIISTADGPAHCRLDTHSSTLYDNLNNLETAVYKFHRGDGKGGRELPLPTVFEGNDEQLWDKLGSMGDEPAKKKRLDQYKQAKDVPRLRFIPEDALEQLYHAQDMANRLAAEQDVEIMTLARRVAFWRLLEQSVAMSQWVDDSVRVHLPFLVETVGIKSEAYKRGKRGDRPCSTHYSKGKRRRIRKQLIGFQITVDKITVLFAAAQLPLFAPNDWIQDEHRYSADRAAYAHRFPMGTEPVTDRQVAARFSLQDLNRAIILVYAMLNRRNDKSNLLSNTQPRPKKIPSWIGYYRPEEAVKERVRHEHRSSKRYLRKISQQVHRKCNTAVLAMIAMLPASALGYTKTGLPSLITNQLRLAIRPFQMRPCQATITKNSHALRRHGITLRYSLLDLGVLMSTGGNPRRIDLQISLTRLEATSLERYGAQRHPDEQDTSKFTMAEQGGVRNSDFHGANTSQQSMIDDASWIMCQHAQTNSLHTVLADFRDTEGKRWRIHLCIFLHVYIEHGADILPPPCRYSNEGSSACNPCPHTAISVLLPPRSHERRSRRLGVLALDLTNTLNLHTFKHNRARFLPREFVYQDYKGMYLGSCTHVLATYGYDLDISTPG
ncbi:hypothetical protein FLONG3_6331 [Fusarium longipes]|uniref:Uncharacterized protein n=1 Tax=Fusarium longipes TaxID=694270 RepID=A0A395SMC0_9HYPO|nr:hypothetical protein FLONG3_6331 [Fusarium longipes]